MSTPEERTSRRRMVFKAKLAEQAERWDEVCLFIKEVAEKDYQDLSREERDLLVTGYKNAVGIRRNAYKVVSSIEYKQDQANHTSNAGLVGEYKESLQAEIRVICNDLLALIDDHLITNAASDESKVLYHKLRGDQWRYLSEWSNRDAIRQAMSAYEKATEVAKALEPTHPVRLGLALNFSVFYHDVMKEVETAVDMADKAFKEAMQKIESMPDHSYRETVKLLQLLKCNCQLWKPSEDDPLTALGPPPMDDDPPPAEASAEVMAA